MNKYTALALAAEASRGERVLVASHSVHASRDAFRDFEALAADVGADVHHANGAERLTFPSGGGVYFVGARSRGSRGKSVDIVFIDWDVEVELSAGELERFYAEIAPCLSTSQRHELIRA